MNYPSSNYATCQKCGRTLTWIHSIDGAGSYCKECSVVAEAGEPRDPHFSIERLSQLAGQVAYAGDVADLLTYMSHHGQSVDLNWGEDNDTWECSWITGGTRFVGKGMLLRSAVRRCAGAVIKEMDTK